MEAFVHVIATATQLSPSEISCNIQFPRLKDFPGSCLDATSVPTAILQTREHHSYIHTHNDTALDKSVTFLYARFISSSVEAFSIPNVTYSDSPDVLSGVSK